MSEVIGNMLKDYMTWLWKVKEHMIMLLYIYIIILFQILFFLFNFFFSKHIRGTLGRAKKVDYFFLLPLVKIWFQAPLKNALQR